MTPNNELKSEMMEEEQQIEAAEQVIVASRKRVAEIYDELRAFTGCDCFALGIKCLGHEAMDTQYGENR